MRLVGIIGYVPPRSLELHGGSGDHLLDLAAALRTFPHHLVGKLLDFLKTVTAFFALIFVKWHGFRDGYEEIYSLIDSRGGSSIASIERLALRVFQQSFRRCIPPRRLDCLFQRFFIDALEMHGRSALSSPRSVGRNKNLWMILRKVVLLFGRELDHAPTFRGIAERGEDFSAHPKIGVVHVRMFGGLWKCESHAAKIVGGQGGSPWKMRTIA
jgi:hypothetical protein